MVSLIVHGILGVLVILWIVRANPHVFARHTGGGPAFSTLEIAFYLIGVASIALGYYFNHQFVAQYAVPGGNPIWGPGQLAAVHRPRLRQPRGGLGQPGLHDHQRRAAAVVHRRRRAPAWHPSAVAVLRRQPLHQLRVRVRLLLRGRGTSTPP
jgi:hypothetical protein